MILYVHKDTGYVTLETFDRASIAEIDGMKRGPVPLWVQFLRGGIPRVEVDTSFIEFGLKENGKYDQDAIALAGPADWTAPDEVDGYYKTVLDANTPAIQDLFLVNGDPADDEAVLDLMGEFTWRKLENDPRNKSATVAVPLGNAVLGDDETAVPSAPLRLIAHYPEITDYTGGDEEDLDGILTAPLAIGTIVSFYIGGVLQFWRLTAGTTAENVSAGIVRGDDYAATTNEKFWTKLTITEAASLIVKVTVADQAARYALTTASVQNGDTVFQTDTSVLYLVTDQTQLNGAGGYTAMATVTWTAITGKPTTISGYGITDAVSNISGTAEDLTLSGTVTLGGILLVGTATWTGVTLYGAPIFDNPTVVREALGAAGSNWSTQSADFTGVSGGRYLCNTSAAPFTLTLPIAPADGDEIEVLDSVKTWDTNNLTLARNGKTIEGSATNLVCNVGGGRVTLVYVSSAGDWIIAP